MSADGFVELYVSGTGFEADYRRQTGRPLDAPAIVRAMRDGDAACGAAFDRYVDRLGRGLAVVCDLLDPDVIVLGGGMSNVDSLYSDVPQIWEKYIFSDICHTAIVTPRHGDSSGVRGAAWLWNG